MSVKNKTIDRNKQKIHRSTQYLFLSTNTKFVGKMMTKPRLLFKSLGFFCF